jgi:hypothetical protein
MAHVCHPFSYLAELGIKDPSTKSMNNVLTQNKMFPKYHIDEESMRLKETKKMTILLG